MDGLQAQTVPQKQTFRSITLQSDNPILRAAFLLFFVLVFVSGILAFASTTDREIAFNTILLGLAANAIAIPVGLSIARICTNAGVVSGLLRFACLAFLFVPLFVHVSAWDSAFGKLGWLTNSSSPTSFSVPPWPMAVWIHGIAAVPQVAVILWLGLQASARVYEDQASLDVSKNSVFWFVTFPRILPLVSLCFVWVLVTCAREITVTDIYRIGTLAEQIYLGYSLGDFNSVQGIQSLDTISGPLISIVAIASFIAIVLFTTLPLIKEYQLSNESQPKLSRARQNSTVQNFVGSVFLLAIVGLPILNLVTRASRFIESVDGIPVVSYSTTNFWLVVSQSPIVFSSEIRWSLLIALVSSSAIISISVLLVWRSFRSKRWRILLVFSVAICCSLPGPLIGSSLLWGRSVFDSLIINWLFDRTIFAPVVANFLFCWPIGCLLVWYILRNTDDDAIENARLEGAGNITQLVQIGIFANLVALSGSFLIVFAICFGELSASQLAVPPGMDTVPRRMLGMLHSGVNDRTAGLTIVSVLFVMLVVWLGSIFVSLQRRSRNQ